VGSRARVGTVESSPVQSLRLQTEMEPTSQSVLCNLKSTGEMLNQWNGVPRIVCKRGGGRAIHVSGRRSLYGCEMLRIPYCLDNRLTDGGKVVSLTHRSRCTPQKHFFASGTHFC
jgi:hypothetical protein